MLGPHCIRSSIKLKVFSRADEPNGSPSAAGTPAEAITRRKEEHLSDAQADVESRTAPPWEEIQLVHQSLPEVDFDEIDTTVEFLGRRLAAPIMIAGMTGGHPLARDINRRLAREAGRRNLAMGVGSQRAGLADASTAGTYAVVRQEAPDAYLMANIGGAQFVEQSGSRPLTLADVEAVLDMIAADALVVHLNFLEEVIQPEGDRRATGCLDAIARLVADLRGRVPVIVKETGAGLSPAVARRLAHAGVQALDVGGRGGTSFAAIESRRAARRGDSARARLGATFRDWGIPTAVSVSAVSPVGLPVIATGGVRSGLDAAKAIALGATLVGLARPMLLAAVAGPEQLSELLDGLLLELRTAMFLTGSASVAELRAISPVVLGETAAWLAQLGTAR
jgi:isopentenyl-diphosphate delta-isomerase